MHVECHHKSGLKYINIAYYIYYTPTVGINYHIFSLLILLLPVTARKRILQTHTILYTYRRLSVRSFRDLILLMQPVIRYVYYNNLYIIIIIKSDRFYSAAVSSDFADRYELCILYLVIKIS